MKLYRSARSRSEKDEAARAALVRSGNREVANHISVTPKIFPARFGPAG